MKLTSPESLRLDLTGAANRILTLAVVAVFLLPLIWAVSASLRQTGVPWPRELEWIPDPLAWQNYRSVFELLPVLRFAVNSLFIVLLAVPLTVIVASMTGFAISQISRIWRRRVLAFSVMCMLIPITAIWLPRFILYKEVGLINRRLVLIVPALMGTSPLYVLLFVWAFLRVPREVYDAARLDGAGPIRMWLGVAMPLGRPAIVSVAVLASVHYWNSFIEPLLYIRTTDKMVASQGLRMLYQLESTNWPLIMTGAILMIAPVLLLFVFAQRYFLQDSRGQSVLGR